MDNKVLLDIKDITVEFGSKRNRFKAVDNVSFQIYKGEIFGLVGESGSGKSTIGRSIMGINKITKGEILFNNKKISGKINRGLRKEINKDIQMIFQDPVASLNERAKIDYIVSEGLYNLKNYSTERERKERVEKALLDVGLLPEYACRFPHEFSGGQRQRIGIARALIMEPKFIIADEPIAALDVSIQAQIINLLLKLQKERGMSYLFIAHDLSIVRFIADRVGIIYKGKIVELGNTEKVFNNPLHPYTKALLSAVAIPDPRKERRKKIMVYNPPDEDEDEDLKLIEVEEEHYLLTKPNKT